METKILTRTAILIAIATLLSFITFAKLPYGGSITPFSMLAVVLIGYSYGGKIGLLGGFVYGLLQFILGGYMLSIPQVFLDYIFAFTSLGLGGFIVKQGKYKLLIAFTIGVFFRYVFACISGYVFYADYTPAGQTVLYYTLAYNATYILPEYILTVIVISIPMFKKTIDRLCLSN